jgi:hypothetical protein
MLKAKDLSTLRNRDRDELRKEKKYIGRRETCTGKRE